MVRTHSGPQLSHENRRCSYEIIHGSPQGWTVEGQHQSGRQREKRAYDVNTRQNLTGSRQTNLQHKKRLWGFQHRQRVPKQLKEQGWIRRSGPTHTKKSVSKTDNPKGAPPFFFPCPFLPEMGFPAGSGSKESTCDAGDLALIPGLGRSPGEGNGYSLQYSCLENSMERSLAGVAVHGVAKSWTRQSK